MPEAPQPPPPAPELSPASLALPEVLTQPTIVQPKTTKKDLEKMKMPELWRTASNLGVPKKGTKAELIDKILKAQEGEKK